MQQYQEELEKLLKEQINAHTFSQVTLSGSQKNASVKKVTIRLVSVKGKPSFQVSYQYSDKVIHKNVSEEECQRLIYTLLTTEFKQGLLQTKESNYQILVGNKQKVTILKKSSKHNLKGISHNREKNYLLQKETSMPFLNALGIMNRDGEVYPKKQNKFRQINRFVEMIDDVLSSFDKGKKISIVDFGCGKSYLTFALYHYLHEMKGYEISVLGLDLKADVIAFCQKLADDLGFKNLKFRVGDIAQHIPEAKVDMVITLHACDIATDMALEKAVRWNADVIMSVPCCQKELSKQIKNNALTPMLKHGILKERFSALATDAMRAQILSIVGYSTQVIEFIETEHTPKNLMIRAIKKKMAPKDVERAFAEYNAFKQELGISPYLEGLLAE